jgi:hypothetical protein
MKKLLLAFMLLCLPSVAFAQCNGIFAPHTVCGNNTANPNIPGQVPQASIVGPGGSSGQIQFNNSGFFGGFTASGNATINTSTGVVTLKNIMTPQDQGAACNGVTDDTTAIQNTVTTAISRAAVVLLSGTCLVTANIPNLHSRAITWIGNGAIQHSGSPSFYPASQNVASALNTIYISNSGISTNDGLSPSTAVDQPQTYINIVARYNPQGSCSDWAGSLAAGSYQGFSVPIGLLTCAQTTTLQLTQGHIQLNGPQPSGVLGANVTPTAFIDGNNGPGGQIFGIGAYGSSWLYLTNLYIRNWALECLFADSFTDIVTINVWMAGCTSFGVSARQSHIQIYGGTIDGSAVTAPAGLQVGISLLNSTIFTISALNQTTAQGTVIKNMTQQGNLLIEGVSGHLDYATVTANVTGTYLAEHSHVQLDSTTHSSNSTSSMLIDPTSSWQDGGSNTFTGNGSNNVILAAGSPGAQPWNAYTPTIACSVGSPTTDTLSGQYQYGFGNKISVVINLTMTTIGTCSGLTYLTLPFNTGVQTTFVGQETAATGAAWVGSAATGTNRMYMYRYDGNGSVLTSGYNVVFSGTYPKQ